jgi:hypothetical protein
MEECTAVAGEAGARRDALCIVIGRRRIHCEKAPRVLSTKARESPPPLYPT